MKANSKKLLQKIKTLNQNEWREVFFEIIKEYKALKDGRDDIIQIIT